MFLHFLLDRFSFFCLFCSFAFFDQVTLDSTKKTRGLFPGSCQLFKRQLLMTTIDFWSTLTRCSLTRFRAVWSSSSSCGRNRYSPQYLLYMRFQCIVTHCFTPSITGRLWTYTVVKMFWMLQIRGWGGHIGILHQFLFQHCHSVFKI